MKIRTLILIAIGWIGSPQVVYAQLPESGEWRMFGAVLDGLAADAARNSATVGQWVSTSYAEGSVLAPAWLYNTRTGTVYQAVRAASSTAQRICEDGFSDGTAFWPVAPCVDFGLVPVPLVGYDEEADSLVAIDRDPQAGDWRMFAAAGAGEKVIDASAWLYNVYTGEVYEVFAVCHDQAQPNSDEIGAYSYVGGCMVKAPVRDTYDQPAALNPHASGLIR